MRIWENGRDSAECELFQEDIASSHEKEGIAVFLDLDVLPAQKGLEVLRVGERSPFCRLKPLGSETMQGVVERNDRIIAINGLLLQSETDLESLVNQRQNCEVTIFDHRTRLTVSWQIQVREMQESA